MRRALATVGLLLAAGAATPCFAQAEPASATAEPDPRSLALATEILDISYPPERRLALSMRRLDSLLAQMEAATAATTGEITDPGARAIYDRYQADLRREAERVLAVRSPLTYVAWARAYARRFTYAELVEIRAFVATPTGTRFVQRIGEITSDPDIVRAQTATMTAVAAAVQPLEARFTEDIRAYIASHPRR